MKSYRVLSLISPAVEESLSNYDINSNLIRLFNDALKFYECLKHTTVLIIPDDLKSIFYSDKRLRIVIDRIADNPQSNVMFGPVGIVGGCKQSNIPKLFDPLVSVSLSPRHLLHCLSVRKVPILLDYTKTSFLKRYCKECGKKNGCYPEISFETSALPNIEEFVKSFPTVAKKGVSQWHINRDNISALDIKILGHLLCVFYEIGEDYLPNFNDFEILDTFCDDLKGNVSVNLADVAFSMSRSMLFTSATDGTQERHAFSVDWHRNTPFNIDGKKLYRVDVVPPTKSGIKASGTERLLFVNHGGKVRFIAYTNQHDFSIEMIEHRLKRI